MTDSIADMLTRIRNAQMANHVSVEMPSSKFKVALAKVLKKEGYLNDIIQHKKGVKIILEIVFKKDENRYAISGIKRISRPGQRVYIKKDKVSKVLNGCGISVISTSKGVMTNVEARKNNLGGEIVCEVW